MKNKKIKILKILWIFLIIALLLILAGKMVFQNYYSKMNIKNGANTVLASVKEENGNNVNPKKETLSEEEMAYKEMLDKIEPIENQGNVLNFLLIGSDNRGEESSSRSDSIMLVSINKETEKIIITSIMRDSYLAIPGYGNAKVNAAYAYGEEELLIDALNQNFGLEIDRFIAVDFQSFIKLFDVIDGLEIDIAEEERLASNYLIEEINKLRSRPWGTNLIEESGNVKLNAEQLLSYARIRNVGNSDFDRTARQRVLIEKTFEKVKSLKISQINKLLNEVLPLITTNISSGECMGLAIDFIKDYKNYDLDQLRIPVDGSYKDAYRNSQAVLLIDNQKNIEAIEEIIYGKNFQNAQ